MSLNLDYGSFTTSNQTDSTLASDNGDDVSVEQVTLMSTAIKIAAMGTSDAPSNVPRANQSFWLDARAFTPGTIPHSIALALTIGSVCGFAAWVYYNILEWALEFFWKTLPPMFKIDVWLSPGNYWLWIVIVGLTMAVAVGASVSCLGDPGDLPYTVKCVHEKAYIAMDHVLPMVCASQFSIVGGASLGPEAPLVAICAALGGYISRSMFRVEERNLVRKHTLMGMAGALAAFFGCPLGGSLFALEVNSRFGVEYYEHAMEAIFAGEVCLVVFRGLAGLPIGSIWSLAETRLDSATVSDIMYGAAMGLFGAGIAATFAAFHARLLAWFRHHDLIRNEKAIQRALIGGAVVVSLGIFIPHTMFWGEYEIQTVAMLTPASTLKHLWPTTGLFVFEMNSFGTSFLVGVAKLLAISFSVGGGYRGGFIFPLFCSGAAFGRALHFLFPFIPVQICVLCMAASLNVALTRTALATTLILAYLSGEPASISSVLAASLVSLFATGYMPFISTQVNRADVEFSLPCGIQDTREIVKIDLVRCATCRMAIALNDV